MFTIDFTKPWLYKDIIYFNQGNLSTNNTLRCKLITGGSDDFTGVSIACTFTTKDSVEISGFGKLIDAKSGIVDIVFPSNALVVGTNRLEVLVNRTDGGVAQSPPVMYDIWQGLTTGNGIEAETNYPILIELINSTNEASNKANLALNKANSMIADITDAIDNAYRSANDADIATSNANTKIEEVETAKTEMIKKVDTSIDTMKLSVEDAKSDMQATTDAKMQQVNNSIVTMKSDVETAKNEMASKADEKIADVDRALAAGTVDLELKASRDGEESLPARLKRDLYIDEVPVKQRVLNLENMKEMQDLEYSTDKGYTVCEKTGNGTVKDLKIYGRSFVNITQFKDETLTLTEGKYYNDILICPVNRISVNKDYLFSYDIEIISNTTTTILGTNSSCQFGVGTSGFKTHPTMQVDGKTGFTVSASSRNSFKINVSDFKGEENFRLRPLYPAQAPIPTGQSITYKVKNMMLIEYTQNPPSYFEGIASVGNGNGIEVSSINKNLVVECVKGFTIGGNEGSLLKKSESSTYNHIKAIAPKGEFYYKSKGTQYYVFFTDENLKILKIQKTGLTVLNNDVNASYIFTNIDSSLDYKDLTVSYDKYYTVNNIEPKQDKKMPLFKDADHIWKPILNLMGIDENNCDVIDSVNNKYYNKYGHILLNGSENWSNGIANIDEMVNFAFDIPNGKVGLKVISDKFISQFWGSVPKNIESIITGAGMSASPGRINIRINKNKLETPDINGFKKWLQLNNVNIIFELNNTIEYEINPIYPEAFEDATLMLFKTGPISPRATWKITSNLVGVLGNVKDRVKRMENDFYKYTVTQNRMQLGTTYSSDRTTFRVDTATFSTEKAKQDLDYDLFRLLKHNILVGPHNYDKAEMENMMDFYVSVGKIDYNMWDELYMLIEEQHNPPVEEEAPVI